MQGIKKCCSGDIINSFADLKQHNVIPVQRSEILLKKGQLLENWKKFNDTTKLSFIIYLGRVAFEVEYDE